MEQPNTILKNFMTGESVWNKAAQHFGRIVLVDRKTPDLETGADAQPDTPVTYRLTGTTTEFVRPASQLIPLGPHRVPAELRPMLIRRTTMSDETAADGSRFLLIRRRPFQKTDSFRKEIDRLRTWANTHMQDKEAGSAHDSASVMLEYFPVGYNKTYKFPPRKAAVRVCAPLARMLFTFCK